MYFCRHHVLICTANHCSQKGAQQVAAKLRLELKRAGLDAEIMVNTVFDSIVDSLRVISARTSWSIPKG